MLQQSSIGFHFHFPCLGITVKPDIDRVNHYNSLVKLGLYLYGLSEIYFSDGEWMVYYLDLIAAHSNWMGVD